MLGDLMPPPLTPPPPGCRIYIMKKKIAIFLVFCIMLGFSSSVFSMSNPPDEPAKSKSFLQSKQKKEKTVYITKTGKKYHREDCRYLKMSSIPITLKKAKEYGYTACKVCW